MHAHMYADAALIKLLIFPIEKNTGNLPWMALP
jgi:hypothetical protein